MDDHLFLLLTARKLSGEASDKDIEELNLFLNDELYRKKFDLLKAHWEHKSSRSVGSEPALHALLARISKEEDVLQLENNNLLIEEKPGKLKFLIAFSKVAAVVLLLLGSVYFFSRKAEPLVAGVIQAPENINWQVAQTKKGAKSTFYLSDSTKIILNADSKIRYPETFSGSAREVYLTGEAFFDVAHDSSMPFIIHTDKMNVKVLGTQFNVKSYPEDSVYETTLIKGSVEVTLKDRPSDRIILKPKEKLIVSNLDQLKTTTHQQSLPRHSELSVTNLHYVSRTDSSIVETSWVDNKMVFQDQSFESLAVNLARRYAVDIEFSNNNIKKYRFTGIFEKETLKEVLDALKFIEKFNYKIKDSTVYIF